MEVTAHSRQHLGVDRLSDQVVTEREAIAIAHDQAGERCLAKPRGDIDDRSAGDHGELVQREHGAEEARQAEQLVRLGG